MWCKVMKFDNAASEKVDVLYDIPSTLHVIYRKVYEECNDNEARKAAAE